MSFNPLTWVKELFEVRKLKQEIDAEKKRRRKEESGIVTDVSIDDIKKYDRKVQNLMNDIEKPPAAATKKLPRPGGYGCRCTLIIMIVVFIMILLSFLIFK